MHDLVPSCEAPFPQSIAGMLDSSMPSHVCVCVSSRLRAVAVLTGCTRCGRCIGEEVPLLKGVRLRKYYMFNRYNSRALLECSSRCFQLESSAALRLSCIQGRDVSERLCAINAWAGLLRATNVSKACFQKPSQINGPSCNGRLPLRCSLRASASS